VSELVSMKMTATERKAMAAPSLVDGKDAPAYPWGLSLTLDDDALEKLDLETLPKVGTALTLVARVEVTRTSSDQGSDGQKHQSVSLQITDCCLEPEKDLKTVEDALYGKKD